MMVHIPERRKSSKWAIMRHPLLTSLLCSFLLWSPLPGQGPGQVIRPADKPAFLKPLASEPPLENAGLFVGINEFPKDPGISSLHFAVNDAIELAHLFVFELKLIPAKQCFLCLGGTPADDDGRRQLDALKNNGARISQSADRATILQAFDGLKDLSFNRDRSLVVASLSSHGILDAGIPYVIPADGLRSRLGLTALPLTVIEEDLASTKAGHRLLLVDACQERVATKAVSGNNPASLMTDQFRKALEKPTGQAKIASCSPGEFSVESPALKHGVFTYFLVSALRGQASPDSQNLVRLSAVIDATKAGVAEYARTNRHKQTIFFSGPEEARSLPLAARAEELSTITADLRKRINSGKTGFTAELFEKLIGRLPSLKPDEEQDREFWAATRDFAKGRMSEFVFVAVLKVHLARPIAAPSPAPFVLGSSSSQPNKPPLKIDVTRQSVEGQWRAVGDHIVSPASPFAILALGVPAPGKYELKAKIERIRGDGAFVVGLPFGATEAVVLLDASPSNHVSGIELVSGKPFDQNVSSKTGIALPRGRSVSLLCKVSPVSIELTLDGKSALKWTGVERDIKTPSAWKLRGTPQLFVGSVSTEFRIESLNCDPLN